MLLKRTLTIDPGVNTGWAYWDGEKLPIVTGVFRFKPIKKVTTLPEQLVDLWQKFEQMSGMFQTETVIIEDNSLWQNSGKSHAANNSGALHKLTLITGGYLHAVMSRKNNFELVMPQKWKGQLTDEALQAQIFELTGRKYRHHEQEAVGIGLWKMGIL